MISAICLSLVTALVALQADPLVSGVVLAKTDEGPVAGADVYLLADPEQGYFTLPTHPRKTQADPKGRFSFSDVPPGAYRVWAEKGNLISHAKTLAGKRVRITQDEMPPAVTLRLFEGCRFRIAVKSQDNAQPIAGAVVRFRWPDIERKFIAGADGIALVEGARPQELVFDVRADGYAVDVRRVAATKPGTTTELSFSLAPGGLVRGVVLDELQQPVAGVGVDPRAQRSPAELDLGWLKTDKQGRFEIANAPLGEVLQLRASHEQYLDYTDKFQLATDSDLFELQINLKARPPGGSIQVTVLDEQQRPVSGAKLVNPSNRSSLKRTAVTDERGQARIDDVLARLSRHEVNVTAKGFAPQRAEFQPGTQDEPTKVTVQLAAGHRLRGRVLLPDGKPAAKVRVYYNEGEHGNELGGRVDTDAQGRFSVDSLPAQCTFTIYSPKGCAPFDDVPLTLDADEEIVIRLDEAGVVQGHVVDDATGKILVPYRIRIMVSPNRLAGEPTTGMLTTLVEEGLVITADDGKFFFGDFPHDVPMQLIVSSGGYEEQTIERQLTKPAAKQTPLEVRLKKSTP